MATVRVWPDGTQQNTEESPYEWMSDDFEVRQTELCEACDEEFSIHYGEPFASCKCGTTEWCK